MTSKRAHGAAVGLEDGLYVIGGMDENSEYLEKASLKAKFLLVTVIFLLSF